MKVRGMPLLTMMGQAIGNRCDNAKGRQMPVHYSWRSGNVVSVSSPVGTQFPQAVGAAMAFAYRGERRVVGAWIGDGTAAQGDFHHALNFASVTTITACAGARAPFPVSAAFSKRIRHIAAETRSISIWRNACPEPINKQGEQKRFPSSSGCWKSSAKESTPKTRENASTS